MEYNIIIDKVEGDRIIGSRGNEFIFQDPWIQFIKHLDKHDELYINSDRKILDENSIVIINPHFPVAVTSVVDAIDCPRKVYLKSMGINIGAEPVNLERVMQGKAMHDVFSKRITTGNKIDELIEQTLETYRSELISIDMDEELIRKYLQRDGKPLNGFSISNASTELDAINWKYGLYGRFDGLKDRTILELKTSVIPERTPYPNHNLQMIMYQYLMQEIGNYKGRIIYLRDGQMSIKHPTTFDVNSVFIARNYAYLVNTGRYIPSPILTDQKMKVCNRCYLKDECMTACSRLNTTRRCHLCYHDSVCSKAKFNDKQLKYYNRMIIALNAEEIEARQSMHIFSSIKRDKNQLDLLINNGYALISENKMEDVYSEDIGIFINKYKYNSTVSKFRKGDFVRIFDPTSDNELSIFYQAIISKITSDTITLNSSNKLPNKIIIIQSDNSGSVINSREAVFKSLYFNTSLLRKITIGETLNDFVIDPKVIKVPIKNYNEVQLRALRMALSTPDFVLIQGPAGTGKTSLIIEIIHQLFLRQKSILCVAFTNLAVDNIGLRLKEAQIPFVRLGNIHSMHEGIHDKAIQNQIDYYKKILEINMHNTKESLVILSTTSMIAKDQFDNFLFDYVVIDEAAQMTEPESLKALVHADKAIFVGDHKQLQPIVISSDAYEQNLHISLFERLVHSFKNRHILLTHQYRMNDEILDFPNNMFYEGKLKSANKVVAEQKLPYFEGELIDNTPYEVFNIDNPKFDTRAQVNQVEARLTVGIVYDLINNGINRNDIKIITPYRAQVAHLRALLPNFQIDTIDRNQGSESDIVIFSTITPIDVPVLADYRRINVALTRAKKKLIVLITNAEKSTKSFMYKIYKQAKNRNLVYNTSITQIYKILDDETINSYISTIYRDEKIPHIPIFFEQPQMPNPGKGEFYIFFDTIALFEIEIEDDICEICKNKVISGIVCPSCGHAYHTDHLITWLQLKNTCPVCKHTLHLVER